MSTDGSASDPRQTSGATSYRSSAAAGGVWGFLQLGFAKGTATVSTFAFAYLFTREEVGVAASALAFVSFLLVFPPPVISDVLVRHGNDLVHWIGPGRKLARFVGVFSALVIGAAALVVGLGLGQTELAIIVGVLALRALFESLAYPALSRMRVALRFRQIASIDALVAATVMLVGIGYAWIARRPEAMVVGFVAGAIVRLAALARAAGPRDDADDDAELGALRYRDLFREFRHACFGHYLFAILLVIDYLVLTLLTSKQVVGTYYLAFTLSTQINTALGMTLGVVVQPIFGHLRHEPERQVRAFATVARSIAAVAIPAALLQAALSRLFFEVALPAEWAASAPLLEILSVAMCFACCMGPCLAMLTAQARFGAYLRLQAAQLAFLGVFTTIGALAGGDERAATYAAYAVLAQFLIFGPLALWLAVRRADLASESRIGAAAALGIFLRPAAIGAVAVAPAAVAARLELEIPTVARIALVVVASLASTVLYAILLRILAPAVWSDLGAEIRRILDRFPSRLLGRRESAGRS